MLPGTALQLLEPSEVLVPSVGCCLGYPSYLLETRDVGTPMPRMIVSITSSWPTSRGTHYVFPIGRIAILFIVSDFVKVIFV